MDEKSQIQALDRTQPILRMLPGVSARQSHDYIRNGTASLFAVLNLNMATGKGDFQLRSSACGKSTFEKFSLGTSR